MVATLKVNQIETVNGTGNITVTSGSKLVGADGGSISAPGTIVQIVQTVINNGITVNNTTVKAFDLSITTKLDNSKILAKVHYSTAHPGSYDDDDHAFALGYKSGATSSTIGDYSDCNGYAFTRHSVGGSLNSFMTSDTHPAGTSGTQYWAWHNSVERLITPSPALGAGTEINIALWAACDGTSYLGRTYGNAYSDAGAQQSITLMEVAT